MKNGKRPTLNQKKIIEAAGLDSEEFLVVKNLPFELHLVNRFNRVDERVVPVA
jgi:hypothetical protein